MHTEPLPTCIPSMGKPFISKNHFVELIAGIIEVETGFNPLEKTTKRYRRLCEARQILMVMLMNHTNRTLYDIGSTVGKDHATVIHAKKTIANLCDTDERFKAMFDRIEARVKTLR